MSKKNSVVTVEWSIHQCRKITTSISKDGKLSAAVTYGYMTVIKKGKERQELMHRKLSGALKQVGL